MTLGHHHVQLVTDVAGMGDVMIDGVSQPAVTGVQLHTEVGCLPRVVIEHVGFSLDVEATAQVGHSIAILGVGEATGSNIADALRNLAAQVDAGGLA